MTKATAPHAESERTAEERSLRLIIDTIPALAWSARADGTAEFFNQHYLDYVGLSLEQMGDWQWTTVLHPEDLGVVEQTIKFHRARIMQRMQAHTSAELMHIAARLGISGATTRPPGSTLP